MSPSSPWKVVLIVEDDSDGQAVRALAERLGIELALDWLPAHWPILRTHPAQIVS